MFLGFNQVDGRPIVLQKMNQGKKNGGHSPLYVSLLVNDYRYTTVC
jgi:hypothetical protein